MAGYKVIANIINHVADEATANHIFMESRFIRKSFKQFINETKGKPRPKQLLGVLWHEGEMCILFANTGAGKTFLAIQDAEAIARGKQIPGGEEDVFKIEVPSQKVLYFDLELTAMQQAVRYSQNGGVINKNEYLFHPNLIRIEIKADAMGITNSLENDIRLHIIESEAKIVIFDNFNKLIGAKNAEKADAIKPLMAFLKGLKINYGLSILILANTVKRNQAKPITEDDLRGSKVIMDEVDSAFAIGKSATDVDVRYIKQIKERNTPKIYHEDRVIVLQINKPKNFTCFEFLKLGVEQEHLKKLEPEEKQKQVFHVIRLDDSGKSLREIGKELGISRMTVSRIIKKYKKRAVTGVT